MDYYYSSPSTTPVFIPVISRAHISCVCRDGEERHFLQHYDLATWSTAENSGEVQIFCS